MRRTIDEGSPVERLDRRARLHACVAHRIDHGLRKWLGRRGQVRPVRGELGLDVEAHLGVAARSGEREDVGESRNALTVDRLLIRKARRIFRAGPQSADVVALQLRKLKRHDRRPGRIEEASLFVARVIRVQNRIVTHDDDAVARDGAVELERAHAELECERESGQGVLGLAARARRDGPADRRSSRGCPLQSLPRPELRRTGPRARAQPGS